MKLVLLRKARSLSHFRIFSFSCGLFLVLFDVCSCVSLFFLCFVEFFYFCWRLLHFFAFWVVFLGLAAYFFASLRVHVMRYKIFRGASNRGVGKG